MNFCETCGQVLPGPVYELGRLRLDTMTHSATLDGEPIHFTTVEFTLLEVLGRRLGMPFSIDTLIEALDLDRVLEPESTLKVYISHLRRKLRGTGLSIPDMRHDPGLGVYRLVVQSSASQASNASRICERSFA